MYRNETTTFAFVLEASTYYKNLINKNKEKA